MGVVHWVHSSRKDEVPMFRGIGYMSWPEVTESTGEGGTTSASGSQLKDGSGEVVLSKEKELKS